MTPAGFESENEEALHFTHDETVNDDEPVGSSGVKDADKNDPLERTRAVLGNSVEPM